MSDGGGDNEVYVPAQYREVQNEGHGHRQPVAHPHTGLVRDERLSRYLSVIETHYDPRAAEKPGEMPGQARDLATFQDVVGVESTEAGRKAMETGDIATLRHQTGDEDQQGDISGIKAMGKVDDLITGPAPLIVLLGEMGAGKTNFAGLLGQRRDHHVDGDHLIGTNIASLHEKSPWIDDQGNARDGFIPNFPTLNEWVQQDGDPLENQQRPKTFIGDEFSSSASGRGKQGHETAVKMAPLIYKIRKFGGALIYIAHGPKSIHPLMWRVGTIIKKVSQKRAIVADSIKNAQLADIQFEIEGVPPTDWRYNDKEESDWSWTTGDDDGPETDKRAVKATAMWTIRECMENYDMTPRATADYVPYSHTTCSNWFDEYQEGGEKRDWVAEVEAVIA